MHTQPNFKPLLLISIFDNTGTFTYIAPVSPNLWTARLEQGGIFKSWILKTSKVCKLQKLLYAQKFPLHTKVLVSQDDQIHSYCIILQLAVCIKTIHKLRVHYAHAAANLNSGYSRYAKVARVHYFCTIALRTSCAVLTRAWASRRVDLRKRRVDSFSKRVIIFCW